MKRVLEYSRDDELKRGREKSKKKSEKLRNLDEIFGYVPRRQRDRRNDRRYDEE